VKSQNAALEFSAGPNLKERSYFRNDDGSQFTSAPGLQSVGFEQTGRFTIIISEV
jgi:hypothetical protein